MASVAPVLAIALLAALFMSFTVGANSNSAPVAPAVGANALSVLHAALLVGIVGSGLAARWSSGSSVAPRKVGITLGSWVGSMLGAGLVSYGLYQLLVRLPGVG